MSSTAQLFSLAELRTLSELSADDAVSQKDLDAICDAFPALVEVTCRSLIAIANKTVAQTYTGDQLREAMRRFTT